MASSVAEAQQEREELRSMVRGLCEREVPLAQVRRLMETPAGDDPAVWRRLADLDLLGLVVPAEFGGSGGDLLTLVAAAEELGRGLVPGPFLGTVGLAATALQLSEDPAAQQAYLSRLVAGDLRATVVAQDQLGRWAPAAPTTTATSTGDGWALTGTSTHVVDAVGADLLLVAAQAAGGVGVFAVQTGAPGVQVEALSTMDLTRRQGRVVLDGASGVLVGSLDRGREVLERTGDVAVVLLGAMQIGVAQKLLELSVDYAKTRFQFGRPIGGFQGVKHRCADMMVRVEMARSAVLHAAAVADAGGSGLPRAASLAGSTASAAAVRTGSDAIQVHGGIGFTWESPVHLYYKRAVGDAALLGTVADHRDRYASIVLDD
ncbi:MAG: acyl-CoA dehydrogenase protein [Frankiales bacterium]|nr:acyl-CoA dehydrogenase protein [Frankiales bacterium]